MLIVSQYSLFYFLKTQATPVSDLEDADLLENDADKAGVIERAKQTAGSHFYENIGQIRNREVKYYGTIPGGQIGFGESKVFLWMEGAESSMVLSFEGAASVTPYGNGIVNHRTNYFLGDRGTFTDIKGFTRIVYNDLWSGIDLVYKATAAGAKYEFHVAPGVDPAKIRIRFEGQDSLTVGTDTLKLTKCEAEFIDTGLRMFQGKEDVRGEFIQLNHDTIGFIVGNYDKSKTLVIDPLVFSTYYGGTDDDEGRGLAMDSSGNLYVSGLTTSTDFPTLNEYNDTFGGDYDCFVFKLNATGNGLFYATYVGGSGLDSAFEIAVDDSGNAYVGGYTNSLNFPT